MWRWGEHPGKGKQKNWGKYREEQVVCHPIAFLRSSGQGGRKSGLDSGHEELECLTGVFGFFPFDWELWKFFHWCFGKINLFFRMLWLLEMLVSVIDICSVQWNNHLSRISWTVVYGGLGKYRNKYYPWLQGAPYRYSVINRCKALWRHKQKGY